jgi:predicted PurR-regulated permease PerM
VINKEFILPLYLKTVLVIIGLMAFVFILYIAQNILIPIIFATILAVVLHPAVNLLIRFRINRIGAIISLCFLLLF